MGFHGKKFCSITTNKLFYFQIQFSLFLHLHYKQKKVTHRLSEISSIKTGVYGKLHAEGDTIYLQASNVDVSGNIIFPLIPQVTLKNNLEKRLLTKSDVLLMGKGVNNVSFAFDPSIHPAMLPSTAFIVFSISPAFEKKVLPGYLAWYLNQSRSQQYLKANAKGSSPPSISLDVVADFEIHIPSLSIQKNILKIHNLRTRERELKTEIEKLKDSIINHQLIKAAKQ